MGQIKKFDNGLRLINNYMPSTRSISIGVYINVGSAYETLQNNGISHFIEHMMFKGTKKRTAFQIAEAIDGIGGQINAYTSKQLTCYYTVSVDEHKEKCFDVLSDIYFNSLFNDKEIAKEQGVVLEEISMVEDTPDDLCIEMAMSSYYNNHSLGYPILGSKDNVKGFNHDTLKTFVDDYYNSNNTVISIAGNLQDDEAYNLVEKYFASKIKSNGITTSQLSKSKRKPTVKLKYKDIEQANVTIVFPGLEFNNKYEVSLMLLNSILGGGMSSLLFQKIREELGLAYSVYSFPSSYTNNGSFSIFFGTNKDGVKKSLEGVRMVIDNLKNNGISEKEFNRGKEQLKGALVLGQESSSAIMNANGKSVIMKNMAFDIDKRLEDIKNVTIDDIKMVINKIFDYNDVSMSYVGQKIDYNLLDVLRG